MRFTKEARISRVNTLHTIHPKWQQIDFPGMCERRGSTIAHNQAKKIKNLVARM